MPLGCGLSAVKRKLRKLPLFVCPGVPRLPLPPPSSVAELLQRFPTVMVCRFLPDLWAANCSKFWCLDEEKLLAVKAEFANEREMVYFSDHPAPCPPHCTWFARRMTSGALVAIFRCLNLVTFQDKYLLPNRLDFLVRIAGCTASSKIDLNKGYHEMVVNPENVQKTFIIHPLRVV